MDVAQTVGRGIALLFHDLGTIREWVVSVMLRPHLTPGKDPVPIVQEAGWAPGPVWTGAENLAPPGFDPRTFKSVVSRYTDWATRLNMEMYVAETQCEDVGRNCPVQNRFSSGLLWTK
jgi:hypothetical protein